MNGIDPREGKMLVPFDLKKEIIEPLASLQQSMEDLTNVVHEHLAEHRGKEESRKRALHTAWTSIKWVAGTAAGLLGAWASTRLGG